MVDEEKRKELLKFRDLNLATLDYNFSLYNSSLDESPDLTDRFNSLKAQVEQYYQEGKLTLLRRWFKYFTEGFQEAGLKHNILYSRFIKEKTGYDVDILKSFYNRMDKIVAKGKIRTESQYRDVSTIVNELCQDSSMNKQKIEKLNSLLQDYHKRKRLNN